MKSQSRVGLMGLVDEHIARTYPNSIVAVFYPDDFSDIMWDCIGIIEFDNAEEVNNSFTVQDGVAGRQYVLKKDLATNLEIYSSAIIYQYGKKVS